MAAKAVNKACLTGHITRTLPVYHLLDFAHACQKAATKVGEYLSTATNAVLNTPEVVEHIVDRTIELLGERTKDILKNPSPYVGEILLSAALPEIALARFIYSAYVDRKEYVKFFSGMQELAAKNPKEAVAQLATFGVEMALTGRVTKDVAQLSARAKEFARLFAQESRIAVAFAGAGMEASTLNPLSKAVGSAVEKVKATGAAQQRGVNESFKPHIHESAKLIFKALSTKSIVASSR